MSICGPPSAWGTSVRGDDYASLKTGAWDSFDLIRQGRLLRDANASRVNGTRMSSVSDPNRFVFA
jgi:hypothetical protein